VERRLTILMIMYLKACKARSLGLKTRKVSHPVIEYVNVSDFRNVH